MKKKYQQSIFIASCLFVFTTLLTSQTFAQNNSSKNTKSKKTITLIGKFTSKQGVLTPLSCYCYEGGEITTDKEEMINICLKDVKNAENAQNCVRISVTGYYISEKNSPEVTSPCPQGTMRYFKVISYKCL